MSITTAPVFKSAGRELELKFLVSEPAFKASQNWPMLPPAAPRRAVRLRSFYYDTPGGALHQHKMSLRMRAQRRGFLLTLKYDGAFPGGAFERGEAEVFSESPVPDAGLLGGHFADAVAAAAGGEPLGLAFETDIRRITHRLTTPTSDIELAFDAGFIIAGARKLPVREIELELKSGDPADLYRLGIELARNFPVRLGMQAKSDRGFLLLTQSQPEAVRASPALTGAPSVDEAIFCLVTDCVTQFTANFPAFEAGDSVNAIHQMRVSLRRLRALLGLFNRAFPCPEFLAVREGAKKLASAMNEARNLDVFLELIKTGPQKIFLDDRGLAGIAAACTARRAEEYEKIKTLLAAPETTGFILELQAGLARRVWRGAQSAESLAQLTAPAQHFARHQMTRLHRKILTQGGKRLDLTAHERHELRIKIKKLRYAAESFSSLFEARKQVRGYAKCAARLQDALGSFNDLITARQIVESLPGQDARAAGIVLGWCARGAVADDALLESWREFRGIKSPFS